MKKVKLIKPLEKDGQRIEEIELKLSELTGSDLVQVERQARLQGDLSPDPLFSADGLAVIAARVSGLLPEDIKSLHAPDFLTVINTVKNFLYGWVLPESMR
ncbi:hypothetical protein QO009_002041 [Brevibacillus aydinogluensis]|jgi:Phage tail assembly chaperone proteins, E, or 41 or 14|uniref:phage tail assembly protein n=1 Tax=Brevibacillus aydinogluensis TaxID=927786 RepID=UPI00289327E5|nr:phage tail assembly protein [Brevibacillus aydinogluensis]MDT3416173.1 hypothetical protein [Brevibacillus aydinogluensis]